jgi:hypothetical protein
METDVRPFTQFLHAQRRGALHEDLGAALAAVCMAVVETGKAGSISLTLKVAALGDGMVQINDGIAVKVPLADQPASMYWIDDAGNALRSNPAQPELPLHTISGARVIEGAEVDVA